MSKINFIDWRPEFKGNEHYQSSNEHLPTLRGLAEKHGPYRTTGGICSSGDVFLTSILPFAKRYVAVDHNYGSLAIAMLKVLLLSHHSITAVMKLLQPHTYDLAPIMTELQKELPDCPALKGFTCSSHWCNDWLMAGEANLAKAKERLNEITFIHGDLRDLKQAEPHYDLIYLSNALEHCSFSGHFSSDAIELDGIFDKGSLALFTVNTVSLKLTKTWVKKDHLFKIPGPMAWDYGVFEKHGKQVTRFTYDPPAPRKVLERRATDAYGLAYPVKLSHINLFNRHLSEHNQAKEMRLSR